MDSIDRSIIEELRSNARQTNQELADVVGLTPSPCLRRVKKLEDSGVIAGYTAMVDHRAAGLAVTAFVRLRLSSHAKATIALVEERLQAADNVQECFLMSGDCDYLLRVVAESLEDYERFIRSTLHGIEGIGSIDTSFAFGTVKTRAPIPFPRAGR
ncbi:Lrp/AsnC family transcriptional regulator [Pseudarthrobacter sp. J75]|uniref:Lrp/AsnC family transcriptional regulator n=1 Tax=unclassified Pseudarthrobacter TaxID=2647000 RepID=UPI002E800E65|nr:MULTISPECIES: Lrp/AsnC family transcriptional regulator [unclassified Pseudarthrobacter]MEE2524169.1 Lrp/AsnC family transcriptional regulator [Pseudarthrobacter sp. J47]MEE2530207.1 Lrp/AsnC family transcriptional regulator [Pseudarthrobacter sp. J75]